MSVTIIKKAVQREAGYPQGQPAPLYVQCVCGLEVRGMLQEVNKCVCGRAWSPRGYLLQKTNPTPIPTGKTFVISGFSIPEVEFPS